MLPALKVKSDQLSIIQDFRGLNRGLNIPNYEFQDMENMTNDYYPVFGNRKRRGISTKLRNPMGVCGGDHFSYVDENKLYYNDTFITDLNETDEERQMVMMGAYLCVFPDGIVYNTVDETVESIENTVVTTDTVTMRMCKLDGTEYTDENTYIGTTAPTDTSKYMYWLDTSVSDSVVLKMWSETYSMWTSVATTYVKIASPGIGVGFKEYDAVKFKGITIKGYNDYDFNDTLIIYARDDDYLIVAGLMNIYHSQSAPVTVKRQLPIMDYVCEMNNRIFGCRYGLNHEGEFVNEIYASKLGDPLNWFAYAGLANDSYAASCGSDGAFTGIVNYNSYVFFFKEEGFHKLYGTQPSNFQMLWKPCRGVQKGSSKSVAIVNDVLLYKSRDAVVAYDGSENVISEKLGLDLMFDAVAVAFKNKYYISMRDQEYNFKLYVYDITKGMWVIEDDLRAKYMTYANSITYIVGYDNVLYSINNENALRFLYPANDVFPVMQYEYPSDELYPADDKYYYVVPPTNGAELLYPGFCNRWPYEEKVKWSFTTGDLGYDNPYNKYVKRFNLRMHQDIDSNVRIEIEYDSSGIWTFITEHHASRKKSYDIPIAVKRADHVRLRISGWGEFRLYSITRAVESGSGDEE